MKRLELVINHQVFESGQIDWIVCCDGACHKISPSLGQAVRYSTYLILFCFRFDKLTTWPKSASPIYPVSDSLSDAINVGTGGKWLSRAESHFVRWKRIECVAAYSAFSFQLGRNGCYRTRSHGLFSMTIRPMNGASSLVPSLLEDASLEDYQLI